MSALGPGQPKIGRTGSSKTHFPFQGKDALYRDSIVGFVALGVFSPDVDFGKTTISEPAAPNTDALKKSLRFSTSLRSSMRFSLTEQQ
jgi:hypothetical protein